MESNGTSFSEILYTVTKVTYITVPPFFDQSVALEHLQRNHEIDEKNHETVLNQCVKFRNVLHFCELP